MAGDRHEVRHARAEATLLVRVADGAAGRLGVVGIRQQGGERRLVGHQRADVVRVRGHQGQGIDGAATAGEQVNRTAHLLDDPMQVIGVLAGI